MYYDVIHLCSFLDWGHFRNGATWKMLNPVVRIQSWHVVAYSRQTTKITRHTAGCVESHAGELWPWELEGCIDSGNVNLSRNQEAWDTVQYRLACSQLPAKDQCVCVMEVVRPMCLWLGLDSIFQMMTLHDSWLFQMVTLYSSAYH